MRYARFVALPYFLLALALSGCASIAPVRVSNLAVDVSQPPVRRPSALPLFIRLDPAKVKDQYIVPEEEIGAKIPLHEVQTFVKRDLHRAFSQYFSRVEVVAPDAALPEGEHWIADVKVDDFDVATNKVLGAGGHTAAQYFLRMRWSFAMASSNADDYAMAMGAQSTGTASLTRASDVPVWVKSCFESALDDAVKGFLQDVWNPGKLKPTES